MFKIYCFIILFIFSSSNYVFAQVLNTPKQRSTLIESLYCPLTNHYIADDSVLLEIDNIGTTAVYIQISEGYNRAVDELKLLGTYPNIAAQPFDVNDGKLTLQWIGIGSPTFNDFSAAIKNVVYFNNLPNPNGQRKFSISIGSANYLPLTGHFYEFVPAIGISWIAAKTAAEARPYFGIPRGYLATITSMEEANLIGKQTTGAGWIGGSDAEIEGTWKWVTGPEAGTVFWIGQGNGYVTPPYNFAFWNTGEPNQYMGANEDYAHITAPGVGIDGSWNDLTVTGNTSGDYQAKGYLVEYGGMPGDPILKISSSSSLTIPQILTKTEGNRCGSGIVKLEATSNTGNVYWYNTPTGGAPFDNSLTFSPNIAATTTYYISPFDSSCTTATRTPITATVYEIPTISSVTHNSICGTGSVTLSATSSVGTINWYDSPTSTNVLETGTTFTTPILSFTTTYYAEAFNNGCIGARTSVVAEVKVLPITFDEDVILCEDKSVNLDAQLINVDYEWSTGETTKTIEVSAAGIYKVKLIDNLTLCSSVKTFTVTQINKPIIKEVLIDYNTATIITMEEGDYEYSIDNFNYQLSPVFNNLKGGLKTFYMRESNNCGLDFVDVPVLIISRFITPNNDDKNDYFVVEGIELYPNAFVQLFDRYGKILYQQKGNFVRWDGNFNGKQLPSSDYWYVIQLNDELPIIKGHFAIIRK